MSLFRSATTFVTRQVPRRARAGFVVVLLCLVVFVLLLRLFDLWGYLSSPQLMDDDLRQHLLSVYSHKYPGQFQDGLLSSYSAEYLPPGYKLLLYGTCRIVDPVFFSKLLGIVLLMTTIALAYGLGKKIGGTVGGLGLMLLTINCHFLLIQTYGGLYRGFVFPIMFAFIWAWYSRRIWCVAGTVIAMALFYPPLSLVLWSACSLGYILPMLKDMRARIKLLTIWAGTTLCMVGILLIMVSKSEAMGQVVSVDMARFMPEWGPDGRFRSFPFPSIGGAALSSLHKALFYRRAMAIKNSVVGVEEVAIFLCFMILLIASLRKWRKLAPFLALSISGMAWYLFARKNAFSFGYPDRYLDYSLIVSVLAVWPLAWAAVQSTRWSKWVRVFAAGALLGTVAVVRPAYPYFQRAAYSASEYSKVLDHLKGEDEPMLIAGWPKRAVEYIPVVAHKEVFVNYEHAQPLYLGYYGQIRERLLDLVRITFATNVSDAVSIRDRYGLTHLLVEKNFYRMKKNSPCIFAPYNGFVVARRRGPEPGEHIFADPDEGWVQYKDSKHMLIDLRALPSQDDRSPAEARASLAEWHNTIELVSLEVTPEERASILFRCGWRLSPLEDPRHRSVFVHFIHEESGFMFCGDHDLLESLSWKDLLSHAPAEVHEAERKVSIPGDAPSGRYRVELGIVSGEGKKTDRLIRTDLDDYKETVYTSPDTLDLP